MSYFNSPIAIIFIVVFVMLTSGMFMTQFFLVGNADMRHFFYLLPVILCVFLPAISMRQWSEEKRGNTFELLLTFPMKTHELVIGKFAASFVFYLTALLGTLMIPIMLMMTGQPDIGPILGGYLGAALIGAFFLSVGIFVSGLYRDQITSLIVSVIACFFFYLTGLDFISGVIDGWIPGLGVFLQENFGLTRRYMSFERGVISNTDILYFIVMTASFLVLNIFYLEDRLKPKAKLIFGAAAGICVAISILVNVLISDLPLGRMDLTEGKIYTVTDATKRIFKSLKSPVSVKLYISPKSKMPSALKSLEQEITDKLDEFKVVSGGRLQYKVFHMEGADEEVNAEEGEKSLEAKLQEKGIMPFQVQSIDQDELGIKLIYSAITVGYKEKEEEIIPRVVAESLHGLEYEIMAKIYRMNLEKLPNVAVVAPYEEKDMDPNIMNLLQQLGQAIPAQYRDDKFRVLEALLQYEDYGIQRIQLVEGNSIEEDIDTLVVVSPESLNDRQRYEINRFLYEGGNVFLAGQQYVFDYNTTRGRGIDLIPQKNSLGLNELIRGYGVEISDEILMDQQSEVMTVSGGMALGPFQVSMPVKAPIHVLVNQENMNQEVSLTGRLSSIFYLWGSSLKIDDKKLGELGLKKTTLFTSSEKSWLVPYSGGALTDEQLNVEKSELKGKQPLAVFLEGQFPNLYEGSDKPDWPQGEEESETVDESIEKATREDKPLQAAPGKLIIMGNSKMFEEDFIQNGGMISLFSNTVDALTLGGELINIRSQQPIDRTIRSVSKIEKIWFRFLTMFLIPIIVITIGLVRAFIRKKEKEEYIRSIPSQVKS